MPLVRISVSDQLSAEKRMLLPHAVYDAMRHAIAIPEGDLFVTLNTHAEGEFVYDTTFMGVQRTKNFVLIHITLRRGRATETKQTLFREIARLVQERAQIAPDDVMVVLSENDSSDWSFGKGEAQFVLKAQAAGATS
jgi:4-oxalocrotonate tautomerase